MLKHRNLFHIASGIVLSFFLFGGTIQAAEKETHQQNIGGMVRVAETQKALQDIVVTMLAAEAKEGEKPKKKECKEGLPCAKHHPNPGETAENGAPCTDATGWVCNIAFPPGQGCGMNNAGKCHTYEVQTGGKCDCMCVMP